MKTAAVLISATALVALTSLSAEARPMHAGINYARYLAEKDTIEDELDAWMNKFKDTAEKNGLIPQTEARSADEVQEDRKQRFFMAKELVKDLETKNPKAKFSTDSPFSLMTTEEFAKYVDNPYMQKLSRQLREGGHGYHGPRSHHNDHSNVTEAGRVHPHSSDSESPRIALKDDASNPLSLNEGQAVKCNPDDKAILRHTKGQIRPYPTKEIWESYDLTGSVIVIDCSLYPKGPDMWMNGYASVNPLSLNEGQAIKCNANDKAVLRHTNGIIRWYPTKEIWESYDLTGSVIVIDCSLYPKGPDMEKNGYVPTDAPAPETPGPEPVGPVAPSPSPHDPNTPAPTNNDISDGNGVDWSVNSCMPPVQNQGGCGSCYAFATTAAVETSQCIAQNLGSYVKYSEQTVAACDSTNGGCSGGVPNNSIDFMKNNGVCTAADDPYTAGDGGLPPCNTGCKRVTTGVKGLEYVSGQDGLVETLKVHPVSVAVSAGNDAWKQYQGGVMSASSCPGDAGVDHAVLAVGFDGESIKLRNSWGDGWGEGGYIRVERNIPDKGTCQVYSYMIHAIF